MSRVQRTHLPHGVNEANHRLYQLGRDLKLIYGLQTAALTGMVKSLREPKVIPPFNPGTSPHPVRSSRRRG